MWILYPSFRDMDEGSESRKDPDWNADAMVDVRWSARIWENG